jgi:homoserine O-acetyltransferase
MSEDAAKQRGSVGVVETRVVELELPEGGFLLDSGQSLPEVRVAFETYGERSPAGDNVVVICHALSGDAHVAGYHREGDERTRGWWDEMVGPGKGIDTDYYHVVCANILGGCKGTTGPSSIDPRTGTAYGSRFPRLTVRDIVNVHRALCHHLGIDRLAAVVGGSFGGMQALEWAISYPETVERCVCIASAASLSAQALAFDVVGRGAITSDENWRGGDYYTCAHRPDRGLSLARKIGHITYLSPEMMTRKFGRDRRPEGEEAAPRPSAFHSNFEIESYLEYQGRKFLERFDANSYLEITRAMDEFDLVERFGSLENAFRELKAKVLVVALSSDWLFPPEQSIELANALLRADKPASYCQLHAPHGHDAFLVDIEHLAEVIRAFMPWVRRRGPAQGAGRAAAAGKDDGDAWAPRALHRYLLDMVPPGARVLDLGCGDGELLSLLSGRRQTKGLGVDIDIENIIRVIDRGHDAFQGDIDAGLASIPDHAYDVAILSETLQEVRRPRFVLQEMLRVARVGIVSFPNFGKWAHRLQILLNGRMPLGGALPFEWHNTPNIHLFTLRDFRELCRDSGLAIMDMVCVPDGRVGQALIRMGWCNAGADRVLVKVASGEDVATLGGAERQCRPGRVRRGVRSPG